MNLDDYTGVQKQGAEYDRQIRELFAARGASSPLLSRGSWSRLTS
jgi:hypothetical protein